MQGKKLGKPNVILIVIDALRARNLGCYGGDPGASPNIDKIAEKSVLFKNVYSCWNTTDQSLTSILSGRYPRTHGIIHHGDKIKLEDINTYKNLDIKLLSQILKQNGYKTFAIDWMDRWFNRGFDYYGYKPGGNFFRKFFYYFFTLPYVHLKYILANFSLLKIYSKKRESSVRSKWKGFRDVLRTFRFTFELARVQDAGYVTGLAEDMIHKAKNEIFFLFLHYWDTHTPYNCPRKYYKKKKQRVSQKDILESKYCGAVSYVDQQMGRLFDILKKEGLLDDTLVIITSDHGESLTEHDIFFDHHGLYEVTTHVPLILFCSKTFSQAKEVPGLVQHIDLAPTICEMLNIDYKNFAFDGLSLFPLVKGEKDEIRDFVFTEESYVQRKVGLRTKDFKYIYAPDGVGMCNYCQKVHAGVEELYELEKDPVEKNNIADENKEKAAEMRQRLDGFMKKLDKKRNSKMKQGHRRGDISEDNINFKEEKKIRKKLRGLGYMD